MGSSRFPGKPLKKICGKPMIGHVYDRVMQSDALEKTVVATCDKEIYDYIESIGGNAVMTSIKHERATDRCAEALNVIELQDGVEYDVVVMVQGDEPLVHPEMINEAVLPLQLDPELQIVNLLGEIETEEEFEDRNCIKVVCDQNYNALYFSREPIPTRKIAKTVPMGKQVCIIPFRRNFLHAYTLMEQTPLEIAESIDMLRVLEHGQSVKMVPTKYSSYAVDTKEDLLRIEKIMQAGYAKLK